MIFKEGSTPRRVAPRINLTAGNPTIAEAKVAITANYVAGQDVLSLPARPFISSDFDSATGVLTLSGTATAGQYKNALRAIRYVNTSKNPTSRWLRVSFQVHDGVLGNDYSNAITRDVQIRGVNNAPLLTLPRSVLTTPQNTGIAIDGIAVGDVDANNHLVRLTIRVTRGAIKFVNLGSSATISEGANDSRTIILVGTLADLTALLVADNFLYQPPTDYVGTASLRLTLNDLGGTGLGGAKLAHGVVRVRTV